MLSREGGPYALQATDGFALRGGLALRRVHALNERCLRLLAQLARSDWPIAVASVDEQRSLWRSLDDNALKHVARAPFLVLDLRFHDVQWWRAAASPLTPHPTMEVNAAFTDEIGVQLTRETLMLAWSLVALDRGAAGVVFGMMPAVSTLIAELGPHDVERIAAKYSPHLRLRWSEFPAFWGKFLTAARDQDCEALHDSHLHGVQLMGSELLPLIDGRLV